MKKAVVYSVCSLLGGCIAFALRWNHLRTGFEPGIGLPVAGAGLFSALILAIFACLLLILTRYLPGGPAEFPVSCEKQEQLVLPVTGVFLLALSGLVDIAAALGMPVPMMSGGSKTQILLGWMTLIAAACLFGALLACRRNIQSLGSFHVGTLLLAMPLALVFRLILTYRQDSVNPTLASYYVELLALVFLVLGFYRLSSFAFDAGKSRRFFWYAGMASLFSLPAVAGNLSCLSNCLLYVGGALTLLGFLFLQFSQSPDEGL